jgi:hypothetical protein
MAMIRVAGAAVQVGFRVICATNSIPVSTTSVRYNTVHGHLGCTLSAVTAATISQVFERDLCTSRSISAARLARRPHEMFGGELARANFFVRRGRTQKSMS